MKAINLTSIHVWENSSGMMFMGWSERNESIIHPKEPGNLKFMANYLGTTIEHLHTLVRTYKEKEYEKMKYKEELFFKGDENEML